MQHITKKPTVKNAYKKEFKSYKKARHAWQNVLEAYRKRHEDLTVILPSYIGWSSNEGSGIFDPVSNTNTPYKFYALTKKLRIDIEDFKRVVSEANNPIVLLVHYFGFPDEKYVEITTWLDENNIYYIEDSAHAMLTDLIGGACGNLGAYNIYALHKMLPFPDGGYLIDNKKGALDIDFSEVADISPIFSYKLDELYKVKRKNYTFLLDKIKDIKGITILYPELKDGICPQTLPILVDDFDRDMVYHTLNNAGYGLVSLYHTMIDPLKTSTYESAIYSSFKIVNLPIHQDCTLLELEKMSEILKQTLK